MICVLYGIYLLVAYWNEIESNRDLWTFAVGLVLVMVAGMFVQVMIANRKAGKEFFDVTTDQLVLPLLFSVIIFNSIWAGVADAPRNFSAIYSAFLSGYFWEAIVDAAKPPKDG